MRGSKCCCSGGTGPPEPCEYTDEFLGPDTRWDVVTESGGTTAEFEVNEASPGGAMDATGDGSCTMITDLPVDDQVIFVVASLTVETSGETGVTIRRIDSPDRIELVRTWGVSDTWELRQGTTVLETIVYSGQPRCKLEIATPAGPTSDVNVYFYDAINDEWDLTHTESGVSWTNPDVLHLGMVVRGEGTFGEVTISPCPPHECPPGRICNIEEDIELPTTWTLEAEVENNTTPNCTGDTNCAAMDGTFQLIPLDYVSQFETNPGPAMDPGWVNLSGACRWFSVIPSRQANLKHGYECAGLTPPDPIPNEDNISPLRFPIQGMGCCPDPKYHAIAAPVWELVVVGENVGTELDPEYEYWIEVQGGSTSYLGNPFLADYLVIYRSTPVASESVDFLNSPTTLNLINPMDALDPENPRGDCNYPATITVTPNGSQIMTDLVNRCVTPCSPELDTDEPIVMTAVIGGEDISVCMAASYNEETLSWEWSGNGGFLDHPTLGEIGFGFLIACEELAEGESSSWTLTIDDGTYVDKTPLEVTFENWSDASATDTLSNGATFGASFGQCTEPPFFECCPDDPSLCCLPDVLPITCNLSEEADCWSKVNQEAVFNNAELFHNGNSLDSLISGFDHSKGYYLGPIPFDDIFGTMWNWEGVLMWCDGNNMRFEILGADFDPDPFNWGHTVLDSGCVFIEVLLAPSMCGGATATIKVG